MAKKRGKTKLFDKGGTIAELKKRCKKETGLEPPETPVFQVLGKSRERPSRQRQAAGRRPAKVADRRESQ